MSTGPENARRSMEVEEDDVNEAWRTQAARCKMLYGRQSGRCQQGLENARCSMEVKRDDVNKAWRTQDARWKSKRAKSTRPGERKMLDARCSREFKAGDVNKARQEVAACAEDHGSLNESPPPLSPAYLSSKHPLPRWQAHQHSQQAASSP